MNYWLEKLVKFDYEVLNKHVSWYDELRNQVITLENVDDVINESLANKFSEVLENAGVFKMNDEETRAFVNLLKSLD